MRITTGMPLNSDELKSISISYNGTPEVFDIQTISFNSKKISQGDLFVSLEKNEERSIDHIKEAKASGAYTLGLISSNADFRVENPEEALLEITKLYRHRLPSLKKLIAITGSVGKTTAKEFTAQIMRRKYKTHQTYENYNNHLGVAISVLTAPADTEMMIIELGMNHSGEIKALSQATNPDIALITAISTCHLENFGSREAIAKAKLEILSGMKENELLVPKNEPLLAEYGKHRFSCSDSTSEFFLESHGIHHSYYALGKKIAEADIPIYADHYRQAVLEALALAYLSDFSRDEIMAGFNEIHRTPLRAHFEEFKHFTVYDDSYSSSPDAVRADLEYLAEIAPERKKAAVLGDMLELGAYTEAAHEKIGELAVSYSYSPLYLFGNYSKLIAKGAMQSGMSESEIFINEDISAPKITANAVFENSRCGEIILVKASHSLRADRIIEKLRELDEKNDG